MDRPEASEQSDDDTELAFPGCPDCLYALVETADGLECPGCGGVA